MHPNGQLPAYEWALDDVNPPVHGWAALRVFELDGARDYDFLERVLHKLLMNFTWWVNRKDSGGNNVFEGGFLGLDNVGPFDRGAALPVAGVLEQSDGTAWMAMYALNMLEMSLLLAIRQPSYVDLATKFLEHFAYIASAAYEQGLWDDEDALLLRRDPAGRRGAGAAQGAVGGGPAAAGGDHDPLLGDAQPAAGGGRAAALVPHQQAGVRRRARRPPDPQRPAAAAALAWSARSSCCGSWSGCSTRTSSCRRTGCARCPRAHLRPAVHGDPGRQRLHRRLRAGRVDHRHVRRQLQLARAGLVPGQPPHHRGRCAATASSSATTCWSSTRPGRGRRRRLGEIADDLAQRLVEPVPAGRRRPPPGARRRRAVPDAIPTGAT